MKLLARLVRWYGNIFAAFVAIATTVFCASGDIIPAERRIDWSPGVPGGIRHYTTLLNVKNPPYNAKGDGVSDDTAAIQSALNAAQNTQVVYLPAGTYLVSNTLTWHNKQIALRGAGPSQTKILSSASGNLLHIDTSLDRGNWISIASGYQKGSSSLTLTNAAGLNVGDHIIISQLNDPSYVNSGGTEGCLYCSTDGDGEHVMTQVARITAVAGNTIYLNRPLYFNLSGNLSPVVRRTVLSTQYSGVEDLYLEGTTQARVDATANILMDGSAYCWITNVVSKYAGSANIRLRMCYACEVSGNWVSDAYSKVSDYDYGISLLWPNSDHLIQNNIAELCRHSFIMEGGGSGVVFAYNYSVAPLCDDPTWLCEDMATHGAHPTMNLFEGNIVAKLGQDYIHGTSSHNTSFRSWLYANSSVTSIPTAGRWAVDIMDHNYSNNVVGCVIGESGDTGLRFLPENAWQPAAYRLGFNTGGGTLITDLAVLPSTFLHGNYDFFANGIVWDLTNPDHNLPASLFLTNKPAWFGNLPWPPFDPNNPSAAAVTNIPAGFRYVFGAAPPLGPQPPVLTQLVKIANGWRGTFNGTPSTTYQIWRATALTGPWFNTVSVTTAINGAGTWTDTNAPAARAFYRLALP